jgi:septum formation protein
MDDAAGTAAAGIVLASASSIRLQLLASAGVRVRAEAAGVDEAEVKRSLSAERAAAAQVAETLAEIKATRVARRHPGTLVVGADQVLVCGGALFDKPADVAQAAAQLRTLRGKRHELVSCAVVVRDGQRLWHHTDRAQLTMRPFSDSFLERYLAQVGDGATHAVGAYQLEGLGAQLFARIEGDYFTILGLPLLPLLDFLRAHRVLET